MTLKRWIKGNLHEREDFRNTTAQTESTQIAEASI